MRRPVIATLALVLSVTLGSSFEVLAQDSSPPAIGASVIDASPGPDGPLRAQECPTGRNRAQFEPAGLRVSVTGPCREGQSFAAISSSAPTITIPDGEVQLQFRVLAGVDRTRVNMYIRIEGGNWYRIAWNLGDGTVSLAKSQGGQFSTLSQRTDLPPVTALDTAHTLALRVDGPGLWGFVDGEPVVMANDPSITTGATGVDLERTGPVDDQQEASVLLERLRVSSIATTSPDRRPVVQGAQAAPPPSPAPPAPAIGPPASAPVQVPSTRRTSAPAQVP